jgi:endonuclease/exonuclease/phosphatase family metal-dependent hydrolase
MISCSGMRKRLVTMGMVICSLQLLAATAGAADTLRVVSYNALNFSGSSTDRIGDFRMIMRGIHPDVAVFQEIINADAVDNILSYVLLPLNDDWAAVPFHDGHDTDNACFYRTSKVNSVGTRYIQTELRDVAEYTLHPVGVDSASEPFRIYSAHLKAGNTDTDASRRYQEVVTLRGELDELPDGSMFIMVGDFNLYTSEEQAYQALLAATPSPNGQLYDPINRPGAWNNNGSFVDVHTQSTRGGSGGGMDDRFDFQLVSAALMDTAGSYILPVTYHPYGNDTHHFNMSINDGVNTDVPDSVADALYNMSDHLPVVANYVLRTEISPVSERPVQPREYRLLTCYPNPFNSILSIEIGPHAGAGTLDIFDVLGRHVWSRQYAGSISGTAQMVDFANFGTGTYYVRLHTQAMDEVQRVMYVR